MCPVPTIDTLIPVPVRELWPNEANDFTPWLHDNPEILGDLLGTELFPEDREVAVGRYSADLLFRDSTDRIVVVENMFGPTDHDHLGKLITYSAGLDAGVAVLIAEEFRDEHRSALDWLNHISQNDFAFFGVIIEAWRIGDSNPAPQLRVDTQPDNWSRAVRSTTSGDSPIAQLLSPFLGGLFLPKLHEARHRRDQSGAVYRRRPSVSGCPSVRRDPNCSDTTRVSALFPSVDAGLKRTSTPRAIDPSEVFDWLHERRNED